MGMLRAAALAAALAFATAAHAAPPTEASIDELMRASKSEKLMETMYVAMEQGMRQMMDRMMETEHLTPQQRLQLDALPGQFVANMREELAWDKMRPMIVQVYQETFTQEEIDGLVAFYKSPVGAALIDKMPKAMNRSMQLMQGRMAAFMERMQATVARSVAEAKKK